MGSFPGMDAEAPSVMRGSRLGSRGPSAKAHRRGRGFFRSAEALLPPHECGGSHQDAEAAATLGGA